MASTTTISDLDVARKLVQLSDSAKSRGIEFGLSHKRVKQLLIAKTCFFTGAPFQASGTMSRSIDRIDSSVGYIDSNVVACTVDINGKKSNLTFDEIESLYKNMLKWRKTHSVTPSKSAKRMATRKTKTASPKS
jgi:hypothetical protein